MEAQLKGAKTISRYPSRFARGKHTFSPVLGIEESCLPAFWTEDFAKTLFFPVEATAVCLRVTRAAEV